MTSSIVANVSLLYADLPVLERFQAAGAAGFDLVESWWPFGTSSPSNEEVDALLGAIDEAGVRLVALNLYAGDMPAGERGVLSHPGREVDLQRSFPRQRGSRVIPAVRTSTPCTGCVSAESATRLRSTSR